MNQPDLVTGVVKHAFEPDGGRDTYELDTPIHFSGYRAGDRVFAWSRPDEEGLAWSMVITMCDSQPVITNGITVACEEHARCTAEAAYLGARRDSASDRS